MPLKTIALNCTLKSGSGGESSSTNRMIGVLGQAFSKHGADLAEVVHVSDHIPSRGSRQMRGRATNGPNFAAESSRRTS